MMSKEGFDNRTDMPAYTEGDWVERFKELLPSGYAPGGDMEQKDWPALFVEFCRAPCTDYKSLQSFRKAKGLSTKSIDSHGGATFWNRARRSVQARALAQALEKSPGKVAARYETELRITRKLEQLIERTADRLIKQGEPGPDGVLPEMNPFENAAIKSLAESVKMLAETNMKLFGDPGGEGGVKVEVNLHQALVQAVVERDREFGVRG